MRLINLLRQKLYQLLKITNGLMVKVYRGYGNNRQVTVQGHVLRVSPLPRQKFTQNFWSNTFAVLRLFFVRPYANATVRVKGLVPEVEITADADGFFRLDWTPREALSPGWHEVEVELIDRPLGKKTPVVLTTGKGTVMVPHATRYACISDIDDTFLVSHSATVAKRMYVLLTENAHSRLPFEGVVAHYRMLAQAGTNENEPNPFFYVSSSEWNLYDYILEFSNKNDLPGGVYLLNQLKRLRQLWKTGQNKHRTKLTRIVRIMEAFPDRQVILLGDDTQEDPDIYASAVAHFPGRVKAVYLRKLSPKNHARTESLVARMESKGVACCYFTHSIQAMAHSQSIGLE